MSSKQINFYADGLAILKEGMSGFDEPSPKRSRPQTREEMVDYMARIGIQEGINFPALIVENGWAASEAEAQEYLETLGIFPWDE